jgi:hypothetical protein
MLVGSINVMLVGKSSRIIIHFSVRSSNVSTKPNQYITNPGPNLKWKFYTVKYLPQKQWNWKIRTGLFIQIHIISPIRNMKFPTNFSVKCVQEVLKTVSWLFRTWIASYVWWSLSILRFNYSWHYTATNQLWRAQYSATGDPLVCTLFDSQQQASGSVSTLCLPTTFYTKKLQLLDLNAWRYQTHHRLFNIYGCDTLYSSSCTDTQHNIHKDLTSLPILCFVYKLNILVDCWGKYTSIGKMDK